MRVIAGTAGGLRLEVPAAGVRPTMDRVKAAIFSSLGNKVPGAVVLDLFAGAGGLGIEALSRGAAAAFFVESSRSAARAINGNLVKASLKGTVRVGDVFPFLHHATGRYDLIFADPPYEARENGEGFSDSLLRDPLLPQLLAPEGVFILEKRTEETVALPTAWQLIRARRYGATEVLFLEGAHDPTAV